MESFGEVNIRFTLLDVYLCHDIVLVTEHTVRYEDT